MMQPNQARKRNPTPSSNLVTSENDKDGSPTMTSMNVDVEGGANNSDNHMENNRTQQDEEREELLARYIRRRAKDVQDMVTAGNFYGIIDTLRPLFDVDTSDFIRKLIYSLFPNIPTSRQNNNTGNNQNIHKRYTSKPDLYGPFVLTLTMAAILTMSVELQGDWPRHYAEQMILSTAIFLSFTCWLGFTCLLKIGFYALGETSSWSMCAYTTGYALSGHCIALSANLIFSYLFYPCLFIFVGLSSISFGQQLSNRANTRRYNSNVNIFITLVAIWFQLIFNLVTNGAGNNLGQHKSVLVENNLDVITDNKGNMVIRPHLQDT